ncbi:MAG: hypothetical protein ACRDTD_21720 [Pseudonocardiaceae bacterium]
MFLGQALANAIENTDVLLSMVGSGRPGGSRADAATAGRALGLAPTRKPSRPGGYPRAAGAAFACSSVGSAPWPWRPSLVGGGLDGEEEPLVGRDAKRANRARCDKRAVGGGTGIPPFPEAEMKRIWRAWNGAVEMGLMEDGAETKYHFIPDGKVLSVAVGRSGQILANGERLTPSVGDRLRVEMPFLAQMVTFYENNQAAGRGLGGGPEDGVSMLQPPSGPDPLPPVDEAAMASARTAIEALVRQGKVSETVGAMVIPSQRGVLGAVGGVDGELYANGKALTEQWAMRLREDLPDLASNVARLQAIRAQWQDVPPADRSFELGACTDPNCHGVH